MNDTTASTGPTTGSTGPVHLGAMMGTYPKTELLKSGEIRSPMIELDFADVAVAQKAFKDVVRKLRYDVSELALMTFLGAFEAQKPYLLLPFVMNGHFHHKSILCRADSDLTTADLAGARVAMRSYSQTTPTWVRGILMDDYGVDLHEVRWLVQEGSHVEEYVDPPWVARLDSDAGLEDLLAGGEVDAIIAGGALSDPSRLRSLIPEPAEAAAEWHARTGVVPINHMVTIRREIAESRPEVVREVYRLLVEARAAVGTEPSGPDTQPVGVENVDAALRMGARFAFEQNLVTKEYQPEELYGAVLDALA